MKIGKLDIKVDAATLNWSKNKEHKQARDLLFIPQKFIFGKWFFQAFPVGNYMHTTTHG